MASSPDLDPLRLMTALWQLRTGLAERFGRRVESETGIGPKDFFALLAIETGFSYPSDLAQHIMQPSYSISRILEGLTGLGLIEREFDPSDARRTRLSLTTKGREKLQAAKDVWRAEIGAVLGQIPREHQEELIEHLETLARLSREGQVR
jgi:DNA-binding MarR family transcriptional regulator